MKMNVPVTFLFDFGQTNDLSRPYIMHEFAANGAKNLVLCDSLLRQILFDRTFADRLRTEMANEGLSFMDAHAVFGKNLDLGCPVPEARGEAIARLKTQLYVIASMGVHTVTIHTGNETHYPEYDLEVIFDNIKRSLEQILPLAEELNITVCIENIWFRINTPERLLAVKKEFPTDALGFCYDAGHANLMKCPTDSADSAPVMAWKDVTPAWDAHILEKMLPHVVNCHLHDNHGNRDEHLNPGNGTVDWNSIRQLLAQAPRLQVIQSEVIPMRGKIAIRDVCATFRDLFGYL